MNGIEIVVVLFLLYFIIRNAVEDGINRSLLVKDIDKDKEDDNQIND